LAWLTFTLPARAQREQLRLYFDNVVIVDSSGARITDFNMLEDSVTVLPVATGISQSPYEWDNGLRVLPNPSAGPASAQFRMPAASDYHLELRDLSGRLVWQSAGKGAAGLKRIALPGSELSAGVYVLSLQVEGKAVAHVRWVRE
jgi:hypothetical protein